VILFLLHRITSPFFNLFSNPTPEMKKEKGFSSIFGRKRVTAPGISNRQNYPNFVPPLTLGFS